MIAFDQEQQPDNVIVMPQKSNEWYTPAKYIEAAREVMGSIDLDPASCELANRTVRAEKFYTKHDNGLEQPWYGNVWLNPPYGKVPHPTSEGRSYIGMFVRKLLKEYGQGNVEQAVLLATPQTDASWFYCLWDFPICFAYRFSFNCLYPNPNRWDGKASHRYGSIFVYLGANEQKFIEVFSKFGRIAKAIDTPKAHPINLSLWGSL